MSATGLVGQLNLSVHWNPFMTSKCHQNTYIAILESWTKHLFYPHERPPHILRPLSRGCIFRGSTVVINVLSMKLYIAIIVISPLKTKPKGSNQIPVSLSICQSTSRSCIFKFWGVRPIQFCIDPKLTADLTIQLPLWNSPDVENGHYQI